MTRQIKPLTTFAFLICFSSFGYAGENLGETLRAQQERQRLIQERAIAERAIRQRNEIVQRQQQVLRQRQQVLQQQQIAYQQAIQQKQILEAQRAQQVQAYQRRAAQQAQSYNQALRQRAAQQQQALQQRAAEEAAYRQTVLQKEMYQRNLQQHQAQSQAYMNAARENLRASQDALARNAQAQYIEPSYQASYQSPQEADEVTSLEQIWQDLEISSEVWPLMMDQEPKILTIQRYIKAYERSGIYIRKPAPEYVDIIDSMTQDPKSQALKMPFKDVLKIAAIIEYDFDNGLNKDQMALKVLGKDRFESNKKRLGR